MIDKWLEAGSIQSSSLPWRAQVIVIKDSFNQQRKCLCIDYSQNINIYTQLDAFPLPRIDDMINELSQYSVFSTFDLRCAYHQNVNTPVLKLMVNYTNSHEYLLA